MPKPPRPPIPGARAKRSAAEPYPITARFGVAQRIFSARNPAQPSNPNHPSNLVLDQPTHAARTIAKNTLQQPAQLPNSARLRSETGLDSARTRAQMVQRLQQQGIRDSVVLAAIHAVPRHQFVDEGLASRAYEDTALPIGQGQTISQPYSVARMIELLRDGGKTQKVLEIGTGCGYQAAVLGQVFAEVYSIERIRVLHQLARDNLRPLRLANVRLSFGDGMLGLPQAAPFDGMLLAAAGLHLPPALLAQIRVGGRIVAPLQQADGRQFLQLFIQVKMGEWQQQQLEEVKFVPLLQGVF